MTITAKFASKCQKCSGQIAAGSQIEWTRGSAATHTTCPTGPVATEITNKYSNHKCRTCGEWLRCGTQVMTSGQGQSDVWHTTCAAPVAQAPVAPTVRQYRNWLASTENADGTFADGSDGSEQYRPR